MIDDIVNILRAMTQGCENPNCEACEIESRAASEIERLRAELAMAQKWRDNFQLAFENSEKNCKYWYEKANNNEARD